MAFIEDGLDAPDKIGVIGDYRPTCQAAYSHWLSKAKV